MKEERGECMLQITALMDNQLTGRKDLLCEHGLSLHVVSEGKAILFDCGSSEKVLYNAKKLGIDLGKLDAVVLGCTHYPFAEKAISRVLGSGVALLDGGDGTARETRRRLEAAGLLENGSGQVVFTNSLPDEGILRLSRQLLEGGA